jgi:ubiquinone/menaquinone biosynthesis C-methylase UbiE
MEKNILKEDFKMNYQQYYDLQKNEAGELSGGWAFQMIEAFKDFLKDKDKNSKILDIGCAFGVGVLEMKNLGYNNIVGADLIKEKIEYGIQKGANLIEMDMHDLKFSNDEFDYSFMSHSIEHSLDPVKAVSEAIRVTKKQVMIITPIEEKNTSQVNSPHTYPFKTFEDWENVVNKAIEKTNIKVEYQKKHRLGEEIWTYFSKE